MVNLQVAECLVVFEVWSKLFKTIFSFNDNNFALMEWKIAQRSF